MRGMPGFREEKATEAAAVLLRLRGDAMAYLKLIKLLYLADRKALVQWKSPITFDTYYSMNHGPVLSHTLNLIKYGEDTVSREYWSAHISPPNEDRAVSLLTECPPNHLSRAEIDVLEKTFSQYGYMNKWQLRDETHKLPEWRDPEGSRLLISIDEILKLEGESRSNIKLAVSDLASEASIEEAFS